jgi:hypothetical protein
MPFGCDAILCRQGQIATWAQMSVFGGSWLFPWVVFFVKRLHGHQGADRHDNADGDRHGPWHLPERCARDRTSKVRMGAHPVEGERLEARPLHQLASWQIA